MWLSFAPLRPENKGEKQGSEAGKQAVVPSRHCVMGKEPSQHEIVAILGFRCRRPEIISIAFQRILWICFFLVHCIWNTSPECVVLLFYCHPRCVCDCIDHMGLVGTNKQTNVDCLWSPAVVLVVKVEAHYCIICILDTGPIYVGNTAEIK